MRTFVLPCSGGGECAGIRRGVRRAADRGRGVRQACLGRLVVMALATLLAALGGAAPAAEANRFGPPWLGIVTADDAVVLSRPALDAPPVGPVEKDALLPVLGVVWGDPGPDGQTTWYRTPVGYLPSAVVREQRAPWTAEIVRDDVPVFNKPNGRSGARRHLRAGDVVRVTGLSPGLDGDPYVWWATTEGWIRLEPGWPATAVLWPTGSPYTTAWDLPAPEEAARGWWGQVVEGANVRAAATTESPIVGRLAAGQLVKVLGEEQGEHVRGSAAWYRVDGGRYAGARVHSSLVRPFAPPRPSLARPSRPPADGTWITIDRRLATLTLVRAGAIAFVTYVSLGTAGTSTPAGLYSTFGKFRYDDMTSASVPDAQHSYDLPNVPSTQYFRAGGYAIHGTYWHDDFGAVHSLGCVNLTLTDSAYLFALTRPALRPEDDLRWSAAAGATPVLIVN